MSSIPTRITTDPSGSRLDLLFDTALQSYAKQTGTTLTDHPLGLKFQQCRSVNSILEILQEQARTLTEFRGDNGKVMKSLKRVVYILHALSTSNDGIILVCRGGFLGNPSSSCLFCSHFPLPAQYLQLLVSYSPSVFPSSRSIIDMLLTSTFIRPSRTLAQVTMLWSTYLKPSNTS